VPVHARHGARRSVGAGRGRRPPGERLAHLAKPSVLVIDEVGYLPFERQAANLLFQLVNRRYERGASSSPATSQWELGEVFGDNVLATAILDRLLHHSHVISIKATATACARSGCPGCCAAGGPGA